MKTKTLFTGLVFAPVIAISIVIAASCSPNNANENQEKYTFFELPTFTDTDYDVVKD